MDRSAPNPIPNSWREGGRVGVRRERKTVKERREAEGEWRYHV